jgi:hypothetical protein
MAFLLFLAFSPLSFPLVIFDRYTPFRKGCMRARLTFRGSWINYNEKCRYIVFINIGLRNDFVTCYVTRAGVLPSKYQSKREKRNKPETEPGDEVERVSASVFFNLAEFHPPQGTVVCKAVENGFGSEQTVCPYRKMLVWLEPKRLPKQF